MFEKEAEEYAEKHAFRIPYDGSDKFYDDKDYEWSKEGFQKGAEFGYNKANEWHKVSDKLPEIDVFVYLLNKINDFPVIARRHILWGQKKWVWDCKWGSGFIVSQSEGKDYLWKEIVLPKESE